MQSGDKKLMRVLKGEAVEQPPIWLMRQAGRYLPEYKKTRAEAGSFLDLCFTPELAEEVTLQPIRRFGFDAAILFADILLIPKAMGVNVWFVEGEGPRLSWDGGAVDPGAVRPTDEIDETLSPVYETVSRLSKSLPEEVALIGFAGAPWTVATYMVAGRGTPDQGPARQMMYAQPETFMALIDKIADATIHYLDMQIQAGAEAIKLFDSWAGVLGPYDFEKYCTAPARRIAQTLRAKHPNVPMIGFPRGAGAMYSDFARDAEVDAVAIDTQVPLEWIRNAVGGLPVQGNLDPILMTLEDGPLVDRTRQILDAMRGYPHIFNLGHGITPNGRIENVHTLIETVRS